MLRHMVGRDPCDATSLQFPDAIELPRAERLDGVRLGVPEELTGEGIEAGVLDAFKAALARAEELGAQISEVRLPHAPHALSAYYVLAPAEASSNLARFDGVRYGLRADATRRSARHVHPHPPRRLRRRGQAAHHARHLRAVLRLLRRLLRPRPARAHEDRRGLRGAFEQVDLIVTPTAPTVAFELGEKTGDPLAMYLNDYCTVPMSLAGIPAISIPCGLSGGLPVGLQIAGPAFSENRLLDAAYALEQSIGFDGTPARV